MRGLLLLLSVLAVCSSACSGGDSTDPTPATVAVSGLRGKLLTTRDLPDGFRQVSVDERDPTVRDPNASTAEFCSEIDQHRMGYPGELVAEVDFQRVRGTTVMFVNQELTRYTTEADAKLSFTDFEKALGSCSSVTKKETDSELAGTFDPIAFPKVGDDVLANTFNATQTVDSDTASISGYFVALRVGRYVALFSALGSVDSLSQDDVEDIANRVAARI